MYCIQKNSLQKTKETVRIYNYHLIILLLYIVVVSAFIHYLTLKERLTIINIRLIIIINIVVVFFHKNSFF